jgi:hypothetical protein
VSTARPGNAAGRDSGDTAPRVGAAYSGTFGAAFSGTFGAAFSGTLCAGLVVLAVVLVGAWLVAVFSGDPGPRGALVAGHAAAAVAAVGLQRVADRRADPVGWLAAGGVLLVTVLVGLVFWWA